MKAVKSKIPILNTYKYPMLTCRVVPFFKTRTRVPKNRAKQDEIKWINPMLSPTKFSIMGIGPCDDLKIRLFLSDAYYLFLNC